MSKRQRSPSLTSPSSSSKRGCLKPPPPARPSTPEILNRAGTRAVASYTFRPISPRNEVQKRGRDEAEFTQYVKRIKMSELADMMSASHVDEIKSIKNRFAWIENILKVHNFATVDYTRILSLKYNMKKLQAIIKKADLPEQQKTVLQIQSMHLKEKFRLKQLESRPLSF